MENIKVKLPKEVYDFLKCQAQIIVINDTNKTYMHLPHIFEVVSDCYNLVIEHYNDKKLPEEVKNILIENSICKSVKK